MEQDEVKEEPIRPEAEDAHQDRRAGRPLMLIQRQRKRYQIISTTLDRLDKPVTSLQSPTTSSTTFEERMKEATTSPQP